MLIGDAGRCSRNELAASKVMGESPCFRQYQRMDLWDRYYASIGRVVVAGGELEAVLGFLLAGLAELEDERVLRILGPDSFSGMATCCRQLIKMRDSETHSDLLVWLVETEVAWRRRNEVVHGWWHVGAWADDRETPVSISRIRRLPRHRITGRETAKFEFASPEDLDELAGVLRNLVSDAIGLGLGLNFEGFGDDDEDRR
jgi:hypothetical protein